MGETMLAYAIDQADNDWRWRVFDIDGQLVAGGLAPTQPQAQSAAIQVFAQPAAQRLRALGQA